MGLQRGMQAVVTAIVFNALAFLFILVRCVSRFLIIRHSGLEDYLVIFALFLSVGLTVIIGLQKEHGLGQHVATVSAEDNETLLKLLYASIPIYNLGLFLVKDSILYQYLRFFVQKRFRLAAWTLIILVGVGGLTMILTSLFSCWPIPFYWDKKLPGGHCINLTAFWFCVAAFNIITDLAIWVLPMPVLKSLQLPRRQKLTLIAVFSLGGFGCITAVLRLHALYVTSTSDDLSYDNIGAATWSAAELNVGIMCACIPAMRPAISLLFPRLLTSTRRGLRSHNYPHGASYYRNDSVVELSQVPKGERDVGRDDALSMEADHAPNTILVKQEWSIQNHAQP